MNEKKTNIGQQPIRDARTLGLPKMLVLGLQHMFAMFGATVLVPILVQSYGLPLSIQTTLFFAGFGTLFFHVCTKMKVPAFLGSSFAFLGGFAAMGAMDQGIYAGMDAAEKLQYACGGIVVAGLLYVVLAAIIKVVGVHKVMHFLPPVVTGPIIILIGLNLAPSAVSNASTCWWLALVSIAVIVVANIWGKGMVKIIPILLGVVISYVVALIAGMVDFSGLDPGRAALTILCAMVSASCFGLFISVFGLLTDSIHMVLNVTSYLLMIFTGAEFPVAQLPAAGQLLSRALPLTRSIEAMTLLSSGGGEAFGPLLLGELVLAAVYALLAWAGFRGAERICRKSGKLDLF